MHIAIMVAMDKELQLLLSVMPNNKEVRVGTQNYFLGEIGNHKVVVGKCGIGKVNAALNTLRIINEIHPDLVINTGVAGGASLDMHVGDVLAADKIAYHDVWCGPGTEYGAADGYGRFFQAWQPGLDAIKKMNGEVKFGLICSGDKFIHTEEEVKEIRSKFPEVLAVDMESAAISHACAQTHTPCLIIRVMSDTPGSGDNVAQYKDFWEKAPEKTLGIVTNLIESL